MKQVIRFPQVDGALGWYECSPLRGKIRTRSTLASETYDVVVIGAGFTGLAAASRLLEHEPHLKIALVEALKIGQGTSGRNAGFIIDLPHNLDSGAIDIERDHQINALNCFAIERLRTASAPYAREVMWHQAGKYLAAHELKHLASLSEFVKVLDAIEAKYEIVEGDALARRLGTKYYRQAVYTPGNILMNPSALVQSVALSIADKVDIYEEMPVRHIQKNGVWEIHLAQGILKAQRIVSAVNAFTEEFDMCSNRLAPVFTYASLTRPLSGKELEAFSDVEPWGLTSAHPAGTTVRFTPDKRIFIRNSFDFYKSLVSDHASIDRAREQHLKSFKARFPKLASVPFEFSWGGMLTMTMNHQSIFFEKEPGLYVIAGCNGVGVAKGTYLGAYMADYVLGRQSKELNFIRNHSSPSWIVPEPLRTVGARIRLAFEERQAQGEV